MLMLKSEHVPTKLTREFYGLFRLLGPAVVATVTTWATGIRDPADFSFPNQGLGWALFGICVLVVVLRILERRFCGTGSDENRQKKKMYGVKSKSESFELTENLTSRRGLRRRWVSEEASDNYSSS